MGRLRSRCSCNGCPRRPTGAPWLALLTASVSFPALAQQPEPPPPSSPIVAQDESDPYEDRPIREVRILRPVEGKRGREPVPQGTAQLVRNMLRTLEGRPFKRQTATEDISRLTRLGRFKTILSEVELQSDGSVIVTFTVSEQPIIQDVQVVGNRALTDQELLAIGGALSGTPIDRFQLDRTSRGMEKLYRDKGYYAARIEVDEKELAETGIVVFRVLEGDRTRVMGITFEPVVGNLAFSPKELRSAIKTTEYIPVFESAPLDSEVLGADETALRQFYKDRGYLDVRVSTRIQPSPNNREAIVHFDIQEGPLYTLRLIKVVYVTALAVNKWKLTHPDARQVAQLTPEQMAGLGLRSYTAEQIAGLMTLKPGDVFSEDKLNKSLNALRDSYGKFGNIVERTMGPQSVEIRQNEIRDEKLPLVDLLLTIDEGAQFKTGQVTVGGNEITKQQVILQQVRVQPDRPLDLAELNDTRKRLEDTRLFDPGSVKISIQPAKAESPDLRDVLIEVKETNTGSFNIGAAVSSDGGLVGTVKLQQRNFDLFDTPDSLGAVFNSFVGGGQTATVNIMPGTITQDYSASLTEPNFFDTNYTASARVGYGSRHLTAYDEERYGPRISFGRRFGTVWEGSLAARAEWVGLSSFEDSAPQDLFDLQDPSFLTGIGLTLSRNTTDNFLHPTKGSKLTFGVEQTGALGGDFSFTKLTSSYTSFYNLYESFLGYKTILKLETNTGWIPQGQDSAPLYERFYLGGESFRGFNYRGVSPNGIRHDTQTRGYDSVGGAFQYFLGAELNQPLYEDVVSGVLFIDSGTVQTSPGLGQYRVSAGFGLRIYIRAISPAPLAFDFGFPILKQQDDHERVFTFSIDLPLH